MSRYLPIRGGFYCLFYMLLMLCLAVRAGESPVFVSPPAKILLEIGERTTIGLEITDADSTEFTWTVVPLAGLEVDLQTPVANMFASIVVTAEDGSAIGTIVLELFKTRGGDAAQRFIDLSTNGYSDAGEVDAEKPPFYTDLIFHRVTELTGGKTGLIIQSGGFFADAGDGSSPLGRYDDQYDLQDGLNFARPGVLAVANSGVDTNDAQFFITNDPTVHLNGGHMIFGQVISGQFTIDTVASLPRIANKPTPTPLIARVDISDHAPGRAITLTATSDFIGPATLTVKVKDEEGNETTHQIELKTRLEVIGVAQADETGTVHHQQVSGDHLYVANGARGIAVFDFTDPAAPVLRDEIDVGGTARDVAVVNYADPAHTRAFVAADAGGLVMLDVDDPTDLKVQDRIDVDPADSQALPGDAFELAVDGDYVFVAASTRPPTDLAGGLVSVDIRNPDQIPVTAAFLSLNSGGDPLDIRSVAIRGTVAHLSVLNFGLLFINISDPEDILLNDILFQQSLVNNPGGLSVFDNHLYMAITGSETPNSSGMLVYNLDAPANPDLISLPSISDSPAAVDANDTLAVLQRDGDYALYDVRTPASPTLLATYASAYTARPTLANGMLLLPGAAGTVVIMSLERVFEPEIFVETDIKVTSAKSTVDFGAVNAGAAGPVEMFVVRNTGGDDLTLGAVTVPSGYQVTEGLVAELAPGAQDTFSIQLDTGTIGVRAGVVSIENNDLDESPFTFNITGSVRGAIITGTVWTDFDGDGVRDTGDDGFRLVTVFLDTSDDGIVDGNEPQTVTAVDGSYTFSELPAGDYVVRAVVPPGHLATSPATARYAIDVAAGVTVADIDFGIQPLPNTITGTVWHDAVGDGARDGDEPGLTGIRVYIDVSNDSAYDDGEPITYTLFDDPATEGVNEAGQFTFSGLLAGEVVIRVILGPGLVKTSPPAQAPRAFILAVGEDRADVEFGLTGPVSQVRIDSFQDDDGSGAQNGAEPFTAGLRVRFYLDDGDAHFEALGDDLLIGSLTVAEGVVSSIAGNGYWIDVDPASPITATHGAALGEVPVFVDAVDDQVAVVSIAVVACIADTVTLELLAGWNFVSLPLEPDTPSLTDLFGPAVPSVWAWLSDARQLAQVTEMHGLIGYWVFSVVARNVEITGKRFTNPYLNLRPGWTALGPGTGAVPVTGLDRVDAAWGWTGSRFFPMDTLAENQAAWLHATGATWVMLGVAP